MKRCFKIVSGGQTGVDRAGLDAAIELGWEYGGWIPKGRIAEDGIVPPEYEKMKESSGGYPERTKANVRDSNATLIIVPKLPLSRGTMLTLKTAERQLRPHFVISMCEENPELKVRDWLNSFVPAESPFVLNIAGPRESKAPGIQREARDFLLRVFKASDNG